MCEQEKEEGRKKNAAGGAGVHMWSRANFRPSPLRPFPLRPPFFFSLLFLKYFFD